MIAMVNPIQPQKNKSKLVGNEDDRKDDNGSTDDEVEVVLYHPLLVARP